MKTKTKKPKPILFRGYEVCSAHSACHNADAADVLLPSWDQCSGGGWVQIKPKTRAKLRRRVVAWLRQLADHWEELAALEEKS